MRGRRLTTLYLAAAVVAGLCLPAVAAPAKTCWVTNQDDGTKRAGTGSNLQVALDAASPGDTLVIQGRCVGQFGVTSNLTLIGKSKSGYPVATLDGDRAGTVLYVGPTIVVIKDLKVTRGGTTSGAGGIYNAGDLTLKGSTSVSGNRTADCTPPCGGGGIMNTGTLTLLGSTTVANNSNDAGGQGGGIFNWATVIMKGSASIRANHTDSFGGGGVLNAGGGSFMMSGTARIADNTSTGAGGGVASGGTFEMSDFAEISGNYAITSGGGVFSDGPFSMSDDAAIIYNTADQGGGAYLQGDSFSMEDFALIAFNEATSSGGGVYSLGGTFDFEGGSVVGNTPENFAP